MQGGSRRMWELAWMVSERGPDTTRGCPARLSDDARVIVPTLSSATELSREASDVTRTVRGGVPTAGTAAGGALVAGVGTAAADDATRAVNSRAHCVVFRQTRSVAITLSYAPGSAKGEVGRRHIFARSNRASLISPPSSCNSGHNAPAVKETRKKPELLESTAPNRGGEFSEIPPSRTTRCSGSGVAASANKTAKISDSVLRLAASTKIPCTNWHMAKVWATAAVTVHSTSQA